MTAFELYRHLKHYGAEHNELFVSHKGIQTALYGEEDIAIPFVENFDFDKYEGEFVLIPLEIVDPLKLERK